MGFNKRYCLSKGRVRFIGIIGLLNNDNFALKIISVERVMISLKITQTHKTDIFFFKNLEISICVCLNRFLFDFLSNQNQVLREFSLF